MSGIGIAGIMLVLLNLVFSYKGLRNEAFFQRYKFNIDRILADKQYDRLISSGFLHLSWGHLILNMISLFAFSGIIESNLGEFGFLCIYFGSLLGGDLLSIFIHRHHGDYSAVGASGAVCGVIFATIALFPGVGIGLFLIPLSIPGWLFGIIYILYSIYGIRSEKENIGHDAHLGGALFGMAISIAFLPQALTYNFYTILFITLPSVLVICLIIFRPHTLFIDNFFYKSHLKNYSIDHQYNLEKLATQQEIDRILDKINRQGIHTLTKKEKTILDNYSKSL